MSAVPVRTRLLLLLLLVVVLGSFPLIARGDLLLGWIRSPEQTPDRTALPPGFESLREVYDLLQANYVEPEMLDSEVLSEGAVRGMLQALDDPYTTYVDADVHGLHMEDLEGSFGGIGTTVSVRNGEIVVVAPLEDAPAARAGIQAGDVILAVDGEFTDRMSLTEVILRIRGDEGTPVRLLLQRDGEEGPAEVEVELVRDRINIKSVESRPLSSGILLLKLSTFSRQTAQEVDEALQQIHLASLPGIIIDLRNNTGGLLDATVQAVGLFLEEGVILYQLDREGQESPQENPESGIAAEVPLVVLVNRHSASASEVFAAAIQDHGRGPLIGELTFGKGSVGLLYSLSAGGGLTVTTARWLTPTRRFIEGKGLTPDLPVADDPATEQDEQLQRAIDYILSQSRT